MIKAVLAVILRVAQGFMGVVPFSSRLASVIFQGMIDAGRGSAVTFTIPVTLRQLRSPELC